MDVGFGFDFTGQNSATGTRTPVARAGETVADYDEALGQGAGLRSQSDPWFAIVLFECRACDSQTAGISLSQDRQSTHRGAQTHDHKVKGLALYRLS